MNKPALLRAHLLTSIPALARAPEQLVTYIDKGRVLSRGTGSLAFSYAYTLNLVAQDFAGDVDQVTLAVLSWIARHQPDLLDRAEHQPFAFEAEVLTSGAVDLSIDLELTERVLVAADAGGVLRFTHLDDAPTFPSFEDVDAAALVQVTAEDVLAAQPVTVPGA